MLEHILVWARGATFENAYSRDRVVYRLLQQSGIHLSIFSPTISAVGDLEALIRRPPKVDAVWVPCFRQRDIAAAARFAKRRAVPVIFDPLISAYDKQVNERVKFPAQSAQAKKLLAQEKAQFALADMLIADTQGHANYYHEALGVARDKIIVLPVGADESVFKFQPLRPLEGGRPIRVLFYGSFIGLHGVPTIVDAIRKYEGPAVEFHLIGTGPMRPEAERKLASMTTRSSVASVHFENWLEINALADRIADSDVVLGVFGTTAKALRVIPNKVYQALAVGRPVITGDTPAYESTLKNDAAEAIALCRPGDAQALSAALLNWAIQRDNLHIRAAQAREIFEKHFSEEKLKASLLSALRTLIKK